jgi:hypothetical protein
MPTVAPMWGAFVALVMSKQTTPAEVRILKRTFYAGAYAMLGELRFAAVGKSVPEIEALVDTAMDEIKRFQADMLADRD